MGSLLRVIPLNRMVCLGHDKPSCIGPLHVLGQNLFGVAILANNEYALKSGQNLPRAWAWDRLGCRDFGLPWTPKAFSFRMSYKDFYYKVPKNEGLLGLR